MIHALDDAHLTRDAVRSPEVGLVFADVIDIDRWAGAGRKLL